MAGGFEDATSLSSLFMLLLFASCLLTSLTPRTTVVSGVSISSSTSLLHTSIASSPEPLAMMQGSIIKCYNEGESVEVPFLYDDPCTKCKCHNQEIVCDRDQCRDRKCRYNGKEYRSGDVWKNGSCTLCTCTNGSVTCSVESCDADLKCPESQHLAKLPGDCCKTCVENDGECSLISDGESEETLVSFDRKSTPFNGVCNYRLAHDCLDKSFWIHLRHEVANSTTVQDSESHDDDEEEDHDIIERSLIMRVGESRVKLTRVTNPSKSWRIQVGRRESTFPFLKLGVMSVRRNSAGIFIRSNIGVKVSWDGDKDLRITLPSKFRTKVCGLCGNYNSKPQDDRQTRKGRLVNNPDNFINSWKVGKGSGYCASRVQRKEDKEKDQKRGKYHHSNEKKNVEVPVTRGSGSISSQSRDVCSSNWEKKMEAMTTCNILKENMFGPCHRHLSILPFYKECVAQVCGCEGREDCYCPSVWSYMKECHALGFQVNDEKVKVACTSENSPRSDSLNLASLTPSLQAVDRTMSKKERQSS